MIKLKNIERSMHELFICDKYSVVFSYETPVLVSREGKYYRTEEKFSCTTSRHINKNYMQAKTISAEEFAEKLNKYIKFSAKRI